MQVSQILKEIDSEIARLQEARNLLAGASAQRVGRAAGKVAKPAKKKRRLSAEGRRNIAEAMKRRWAERRKQTAAKGAKAAAGKGK